MEGWVIFLIALAMMAGLHLMLKRTRKAREPLHALVASDGRCSSRALY
jgi:hypothetical protein